MYLFFDIIVFSLGLDVVLIPTQLSRYEKKLLGCKSG
jgi:hypothetical protein